MATTIDHLKSLLEEESVPAFDNSAGTVICPFHYEGHLFNLEIKLQEGGMYLQFKIPYFLNLAEASAQEKTLLKLMKLNRHYKALKFGLGPCDGEVTASIDVPLEDMEFTLYQMNYCLYGLMVIAMRERDLLLTLFRTGIYPSSDDPDFTKKLDRLMAGT